MKMPTTAPAGWVIAHSDDFNGSDLDPKAWWRWGGKPGAGNQAWWFGDQLHISNSMLTIITRIDWVVQYSPA